MNPSASFLRASSDSLATLATACTQQQQQQQQQQQRQHQQHELQFYYQLPESFI
jgi:hypothetical protein